MKDINKIKSINLIYIPVHSEIRPQTINFPFFNFLLPPLMRVVYIRTNNGFKPSFSLSNLRVSCSWLCLIIFIFHFDLRYYTLKMADSSKIISQDSKL
jgi:hypothetical protein